MLLDAQPPRRKKKRWIFIFLVLAVLVLVVPPRLTIGRFQKRLEASMSAAVGRPVTVAQVHPRLLPQPGFDLEGFAIHDDPAMSSEPLLRADAVTADLRLLSLWRGRIEIAKLSLQDPSLNLVRANDGHWNVEALLAHAAQVPMAPTAKRLGEERPRFPYIEANSGRINFKIGEEKRVYAFTEADFAIWLASESEWQMRLSARPIRTDEDLGDLGTLRLNGSLERASQGGRPLHLRLEWQNAQLGQLTELIYGRDRGWRGTVALDASISGSPQVLNISGTVGVRDFRRYDIASGEPMNINVRCDALYQRGPDGSRDDTGMKLPALRATCSWARGSGLLNATLNASLAEHQSELRITAAAFPISEIVALARHMKRGVTPDLTASGALNGTLLITRGSGPQPVLVDANSSTLTATAELRSATLAQDLDLGTIVFNFQQPIADQPANAVSKNKNKKIAKPLTGFALVLLPANVQLGGTSPLVVSGVADASGYDLQLAGEAESPRLQQSMLALGLPELQIDPAAGAKSKIDLHIQGMWTGFPAPVAVGSVHPEGPTALARSKVQ